MSNIHFSKGHLVPLLDLTSTQVFASLSERISLSVSVFEMFAKKYLQCFQKYFADTNTALCFRAHLCLSGRIYLSVSVFVFAKIFSRHQHPAHLCLSGRIYKARNDDRRTSFAFLSFAVYSPFIFLSRIFSSLDNIYHS